MTDWSKLKVVDLKAELKRRDLPQQGLKVHLVARLEEADAASADKPEGNEEDGVRNDGNSQNDEDSHATVNDAAPEEPAAVVEAQHTEDDAAPPDAPEHSSDTMEETLDPVQEDHVVDEPELPSDPPALATEIAIEPVEAPAAPEPRATAEPSAVTEPTEAHEPMEGVVESEAPPETQDLTRDSSEQQDPEILQDAQKRKRRSASPPPNAEVVAKRARVDHENGTEGAAAGGTAGSAVKSEEDAPKREAVKSMDRMADIVAGGHSTRKFESTNARGNTSSTHQNLDLDRTVAPSRHPATSALYISNLMRPLRPSDVQTHLIDLATPPGVPLSEDIIVEFHLDQIRTHSFVVFNSTSAASRVRTLLHDCVWPNESNRKALWVDFVPPEKVSEWIRTESSGGVGPGGRSTKRWEVVYGTGADGEVEASLEQASASQPRAGPAPGNSRAGNGGPIPPIQPDSANNIPIGPRFQRDFSNVPTGPRAKRSGPGPRPPPMGYPHAGPSGFGGAGKQTRATPSISYQPVSEELVQSRLANIRSHYRPGSSHQSRDPGGELNRYSFEDGDLFVDRGKEVFKGIRPPHRERARERDRRGGAGGRGPRGRGSGSFRPRSDRYVPGGDRGGDYKDRSYARDDRRDRDRGSHRGWESRDRR